MNYTVGFGHGISVTPLHVVAGTAAVANGGVLLRPTILAVDPSNRPEGTRVMQQSTSDTMRRLMRLVVTSGFGKKAGAAAHKLLSDGMVHVIASDAHDPVHRHPQLDEAFQAIGQQYGPAVANLLFEENPGKIIRGQFVSNEKFPVERRKKWWPF